MQGMNHANMVYEQLDEDVNAIKISFEANDEEIVVEE